MFSHPLNSEAGQQSMERNRLGLVTQADDRAARANRYELALHNLENANPQQLCLQVIEALNNADSEFDLYLHDAIHRRDEKLIGKLLLKAVELHRHHVAEGVSEQ